MQGSTVDYCSNGDEHYWITTSHARSYELEPPIVTRQCHLCGYLDLTELRQTAIRPKLRPGITACIAAHPGRLRNGKLNRALASVSAQTLQPDAIVVGNDIGRRGAAHNRQMILDQVQTEWMAWLDSDDEWMPQHLEKLWAVAANPDLPPADRPVFVYPWFETINGDDPLGHFGLPFRPATPHHTTIVFMVRTELARRVGFGDRFFTQTPTAGLSGEDWLHIIGLCQIAVAEGLQMVHLAERTWRWYINDGNTHGVPGQGDAV